MHQIHWYVAARNELAELWLNGDSEFRTALARLVAGVERLLQWHPHEAGESRGGNDRIVFVDFAVLYIEVDDVDKIVWVTQIKLR